MMHPSVKVQIAPSSVPATPSWFGEVAVLAHVLTQFGVLDAIGQRARFARARFGLYDTIDFVVVLIGYAVSGEPTLKAFYERLWPFASTFMALFGRNALPVIPPSAVFSRLLIARCRSPPASLSRGSGGTIHVRFSTRWGVGSSGKALVSGRYRWNQTGSTTAGTSPDKRPSRSSSSFRSGVRQRVFRAQARTGGANQDHGVTAIHASMARHLFRSRKRRLPSRIATSAPSHHGVRGRACASPLPGCRAD